MKPVEAKRWLGRLTLGCAVAAWISSAAAAGQAAAGNPVPVVEVLGAAQPRDENPYRDLLAAQAIVIGTSTRADIEKAFGQADVTRFANRYELRLHQVGYAKAVDGIPYVNLVVSSADNRRELTILFDLPGIVRTYRLLDRADRDPGA